MGSLDFELREVEVGGRRVRWRYVGQGPPVVFVHGLSGSWRWWAPSLPQVAERYGCHVLDVPRFGRGMRPDDTAQWLAAWADAAGLGRMRVVGHSLGADAAARLAAARADLVEALVLVSPAGMPTGRGMTGYVGPLLSALRVAPRTFLPRLGVDALRTGPEALLRGIAYVTGADVREAATAIQAPTLLLWGSDDTLVPSTLAVEWQHALASSHLTVLGEVGHVPMIERPREFSEALLAFFDEPSNVVGGRPVGGVRRTGDDGKPTLR